MAGETAVETPQAPVAEEKKDLAEVSKEEEKKDEEKKEEVKEDSKTSKTPAKEKKEKKAKAPPAPQVHKKDYEKDVVYLYQFGRTKVMPSLSPYCLKLETWLKLQGVKYEVGGLSRGY